MLRFARFSLLVLLIALPALCVRSADAVALPSGNLSFSAQNLPLKQALSLFARANQLNIVPDLDIEGEITVDFNNLPLEHAMRALLEAHGYYFVQDGPLIRVRNRETRLFHLDYIHLVRAGQGSSAVQISSGSSSSGGGGSAGGSSGGGEGSSMTVTANSTIDFWKDLSDQLKTMLSPTGTYTINNIAGTIQISDNHRTVEAVGRYLKNVSEGILRQIDLQVEIYEVTLGESQSLGIDWNRIASGYTTRFATGLIIRNPANTPTGQLPTPPAFGPTLPSPTIGGTTRVDNGIVAAIEALKQQGNLKIVSQPRLRTLNNQPAVVRVGQDIPVFIRQVTQAPGTPPVVTTSESLQTITVGTVLSITPQVSPDGLITLDISPAVSRLVRTETSASGDTNAPVIDIRQASSLVRIRDGDTIIMGGLVQDSHTTTTRRIPLLGDIPLLGKAFSAQSKNKERTELIFFLTPRIIPPDASENAAKPNSP